ncbi:MAG: hypothetical protein L0210_04780, partial [Rhodospirillales bacterium]|nr:hypothetical protein [Rhodospirillales bacterium]
VNDFGKAGYGGPCPPRGHGPHRYIFRLYVLPVERLGLPARSHCREIEKTAAAQALAVADLTGIYSR